ncbi:MAG: isoprenyl transferase, partial [Gammaproteobacteria bacterium]|nr:isoprenyl transferase [Gammaproteobacteria bacterium]
MNTMTDPKIEAIKPKSDIPRHVAVIMDGNGRWAKSRGLPRFAGHKAGVDSVRKVVSECAKKGVEVLTLFAFSSENWKRPEKEVGSLMELFLTALRQEVKKLHRNNVRLKIIGGRHAFSEKLQKSMRLAEEQTADNTGLTLVIAANYGGRWDIVEAVKKLAQEVKDGQLEPEQINEQMISDSVALAELPEPDLFIRTSGEQRISNFLLWQLAYTELFFSDRYWPDFDEDALQEAFNAYAGRERRYGLTGEQIGTA